ncbi:TolC family protein [Halarcobacter sp.]|uniref:TolC family protein n=1 Tax=Halarcobacter sp. TaxID=2321133 RepID=UPI0029F487A1|nr:TolC family protein [Halarcobacter sp.]
MKNKFFVFLVCTLFTSLYAESLTFSQTYNLALDKSNEILSSKYVYQSRKEDINQVKANLYPQLSGKVSYSNMYSQLNELLERDDDKERERNLEYNISLRQNIYDPELYSKIRMERKRVKLSEITYEKNKQELFNTTFESYIKIFKLQNRISLLESKTKYYGYLNDAAKKKYKLSLMSRMDMLEAEVDYNTSKIELKKEKQLLVTAKNDLAQLIEISDFTLPEISYNIGSEKLNQLKAILENEEAYLNSLEVQEAKISKEYSKEALDNAFDAHLPKLSFDASYSKYYSPDIASDYENTSRYMVALTIPIYQGGAVNSRVKSSRLKYNSTLEDLKLSQKKSKTEFLENKSEFEAALESLELYNTSLKSANLYLESIEKAYEKDLKSIIDLYEAKTKLDELKFSYIDTISNLITAYANLLRVTNNFEKIELIDDVI